MSNKLLKPMASIIGTYKAVLESNLILLESIPEEDRTYGILHMIESNRNALNKGEESWKSMIENKNDNNE
jgi:predicted RNA-binding protein with PUA domain